LAWAVKDAKTLVTLYQQVIDRYNFTYLDFDIEGAAINDIASNNARIEALVALRKNNPFIKISYTLPVLPSGLTLDGVNLLKAIVKYGLLVDRINLMTMDYVCFFYTFNNPPPGSNTLT
jgi:hypothetical protein